MNTYTSERIIFIVLAALCGAFFLAFLIWIYCTCRKMRRECNRPHPWPENGTDTAPPPGTPSYQSKLSDKVREQILERASRPCNKISSKDVQLKGEQVCTICLEKFGDGSGIKQLGYLCVCHHSFHFDCLWSWLDHSSSCPVCRQRVHVSEHSVKVVTYEFAEPRQSPTKDVNIVDLGKSTQGDVILICDKVENENKEEGERGVDNHRGAVWWRRVVTIREVWRQELSQMLTCWVDNEGPGDSNPDLAISGDPVERGATIYDWPIPPPSGYWRPADLTPPVHFTF